MLYTERAHFYHRYKVPPIFYLINLNAVSFGLKALVPLGLNPPVRGGVHLMLFNGKSYFKTGTKHNSWMLLNLDFWQTICQEREFSWICNFVMSASVFFVCSASK
jgi:hypothetical protein